MFLVLGQDELMSLCDECKKRGYCIDYDSDVVDCPEFEDMYD